MNKFLERDDLPPATSTKLLQVLNDPAKTRKLKIEIATTVDAMEPFVNTKYKLECDGPLGLRLFSPFKFHELKPSATDVDCLKAFPFLSSQETIDRLKMEIPMYMAASEDISTEIDLIAWWKIHAIELLNGLMLFKRYYYSSHCQLQQRGFFFNFTKIYCATAVIFGRLHRTFCNAAQEYNFKMLLFNCSCS